MTAGVAGTGVAHAAHRLGGNLRGCLRGWNGDRCRIGRGRHRSRGGRGSRRGHRGRLSGSPLRAPIPDAGAAATTNRRRNRPASGQSAILRRAARPAAKRDARARIASSPPPFRFRYREHPACAYREIGRRPVRVPPRASISATRSSASRPRKPAYWRTKLLVKTPPGKFAEIVLFDRFKEANGDFQFAGNLRQIEIPSLTFAAERVADGGHGRVGLLFPSYYESRTAYGPRSPKVARDRSGD